MPERSCLGCGAKKEKALLVRLAVRDGAVVADPEETIPGRGAYICPERSCAAKAAGRKGAFSRAFRKNVPAPDPDELCRMAERAGKK